MNQNPRPFAHLTDTQLLDEVRTLAGRERDAAARLIASLAELDARRLYLGEGYSSLFTYCTQALHLSEHAAYGRIEAARAARKFPVILALVADGSITVTTVRLLSPILTIENHQQVLAAAQHKSKREVEVQVAALRPLPPVPSTVRRLPILPAPPRSVLVTAPDDRPPCASNPPASGAPAAVAHPASAVHPPRAAVVVPLAPERYKVQLTITRDTHDKLRRVQDLMRHAIPDGDPAIVFDRALTLLLADLERKKLAAVDRPRRAAEQTCDLRHIPAAVKREVWVRDGGQCAFVGARRRCGERGFLEFHHVVPFADGGPTTVENLQLRCRAHNLFEADQYFGTPEPSLFEESSAESQGDQTRSGPDRAECRRKTRAAPRTRIRQRPPAVGRRPSRGSFLAVDGARVLPAGFDEGLRIESAADPRWRIAAPAGDGITRAAWIDRARPASPAELCAATACPTARVN